MESFNVDKMINEGKLQRKFILPLSIYSMASSPPIPRTIGSFPLSQSNLLSYFVPQFISIKMKYYRHFCCPSFGIPVDKASFYLSILCILYNLIIIFAISSFCVNCFDFLFAKHEIGKWQILAIIFPLAAINSFFLFLNIFGYLLRKPAFYLPYLIFLALIILVLALALFILIGLTIFISISVPQLLPFILIFNFLLLFLLLSAIWIFSAFYRAYEFLNEEKRASRRYSQNGYISTLFYSTQPTAV